MIGRSVAFLAMIAAAVGSTPAASADVTLAASDRLEFSFSADVAGTKSALWRRIVKPSLWWSDSHTYSGKSANMKLTEKAGGCWCETWSGGEVEHGRVVFLTPESQLRIETALGPFQEMGVSGVMAIKLSPGSDAAHTKLELTYKVSGASALKLDQMAAPVNDVLEQQFKALAKVG